MLTNADTPSKYLNIYLASLLIVAMCVVSSESARVLSMNVTKAGDDNHFADINNQSLNCLYWAAQTHRAV